MIKLTVLFALCAVAFAANLRYDMPTVDTTSSAAVRDAFLGWTKHFGKHYSNDAEYSARMEVFRQKVEFIQAHNAQYKAGQKSFFLRVNQFSDLTSQEYRKKVLAPPRSAVLPKKAATLPAAPWGTPAGGPGPLNPVNPFSLDFKSKGAVTGIKDQGQCGSCWAFSTTGSIECAHWNATGQLVSLSESQLVDCSGAYGNEGCDGGDMGMAMQYVIDIGFIQTEASYPYVPFDGKCKADKTKAGASISRYVNITSGSDIDLENHSVKGTVSVAIDASADEFQSYGGGVYEVAGCSQTELDHGVLVTGYGYLGSTPYWQVKNSWGYGWGDNGWIKMRKAATPTDEWANMCGIATMATQPFV